MESSAPGEPQGWDGSTYRISPLIRFGRSTTNSGAGSNRSSSRTLRRRPKLTAVARESIGDQRSTGSFFGSAPDANGTSFPSTLVTTVRSIVGFSGGAATVSFSGFGPF